MRKNVHLNSIRNGKEMNRSLTRAPELLRLQVPPSNGTQKGDIYSFAILLYEIYGRKGPFGFGYSNDFDSLSKIFKEIIEKLINPPNAVVVLRPPLNLIDAPECVKQSIVLCWNEEPDNRPDMRLVRLKLKELQGGLWVEAVFVINHCHDDLPPVEHEKFIESLSWLGWTSIKKILVIWVNGIREKLAIDEPSQLSEYSDEVHSKIRSNVNNRQSSERKLSKINTIWHFFVIRFITKQKFYLETIFLFFVQFAWTLFKGRQWLRSSLDCFAFLALPTKFYLPQGKFYFRNP